MIYLLRGTRDQKCTGIESFYLHSIFPRMWGWKTCTEVVPYIYGRLGRIRDGFLNAIRYLSTSFYLVTLGPPFSWFHEANISLQCGVEQLWDNWHNTKSPHSSTKWAQSLHLISEDKLHPSILASTTTAGHLSTLLCVRAVAIGFFYCWAQVLEYFDADLSVVLHCGPLAHLPPLMLQPFNLEDGLLKSIAERASRALDPSSHHPGPYSARP